MRKQLPFLFLACISSSLLAQNIGIGTATPAEKLHIAGTLRANALQTATASTAATDKVVWVDANGKLYAMPAGTAGQVLAKDASNFLTWQTLPADTVDWHITGNNGIAATHFIGTLNNAALKVRTNNIYSGEINPNGLTTLGISAGQSNPPSSNTFIGGYSGSTTSTGTNNTAVGLSSLTANISGSGNTAIGASAIGGNTTGSRNVAVGQNALTGNTIGSDNIGIGQLAGTNNITAGRNVAIGTEALSSQSFSNAGVAWTSNNIAIGHQTLRLNQPTATLNGINNIAIGSNSLDANLTGSRNIAIGTDALGANNSGVANIAIGRDALQANTSTSQNTAIGTEALKFVAGGTNNTAIGYQANNIGVSGSENTFIGANAAQNNTGSNNVAIGSSALNTNTAGTQNVVVGMEAGQTSTGSRNIFLGYRAGQNELGSDKLYIENSNSASPLIGGDFASNRVGINSAAASHTLYINGGPTWTSNTWTGSVELNSAAAIGWRANLSGKTFGMGYTNNGFYLWNSSSALANTASAAEYRMIVHDNGGTAIGANMGGAYTPSAPLHVDGFINGGIGNFAYFSYNGTCNVQGCASGTTDVSIYATNRIRASEFNAFSDSRIKHIIGESSANQDLATLMKLIVTDYTHIDVVGKGAASKKGFIAQQIETEFPEAVSQSRDFIPNVYEVPPHIQYTQESQILEVTTSKPHEFISGDIVKLIGDKTYELPVEVKDAQTFLVKNWKYGKQNIFVFGKEVSDFRAVDYDRIFTLNVSATQALAKKVQELEKENAQLKSEVRKIHAIEHQIEALNDKILSPKLSTN